MRALCGLAWRHKGAVAIIVVFWLPTPVVLGLVYDADAAPVEPVGSCGDAVRGDVSAQRC